MLYNTDIGILVYRSLYKKLNYHNSNLKKILILDKLDKLNIPINYKGPKKIWLSLFYGVI